MTSTARNIVIGAIVVGIIAMIVFFTSRASAQRALPPDGGPT